MKASKIIVSGAIAIALSAVSPSSNSEAYDTSGFWPSENYPSRSHAYDHLLQDTGVSQASLDRLALHVAFPQSRGALVGLLGWPTAYSGPYDYYKISGSNNEIAIYYEGDTALFFNVGY